MVPVVQLVLKPAFLQPVHVLQIFHFLGQASLNLNSHFLSHLDVFAVGDALIMEDVDIGYSFGLETSIEFLTPLRQEGVPGNQGLVGFLLSLKVSLQKLEL